jgi:hypothetical protein
MSDPRRIFPVEVVQLHDEQGIPWPTWFAGPLYVASPEVERAAMNELLAVRKAAQGPGTVE